MNTDSDAEIIKKWENALELGKRLGCTITNQNNAFHIHRTVKRTTKLICVSYSLDRILGFLEGLEYITNKKD